MVLEVAAAQVEDAAAARADNVVEDAADVRERVVAQGHRVVAVAEVDAKAVHEEVAADIDAAVEFAENSPYPEPDALLEDVYA